jgi:hypothetical protein
MHNIDRTQQEFWGEVGEYESGGYGLSGEGEYYGETPYSEAEFEYGYEAESTGLFSEVDEMALAAELLDVRSEAELEEFLGKLIRSAGRLAGKALNSSVGRQIGGMLKGVAKTALPMVGGALGNLVLPGVGGAVGSRLASAAGSMFGLELEGMSQEDQEFELARRVVRLGGEAVRQAALASGMPPQAAVQAALMAAARQHAPGLVGEVQRLGTGGMPTASMGQSSPGQFTGGQSSGGQYGSRSSGRWIRRGNRIVLLGIS